MVGGNKQETFIRYHLGVMTLKLVEVIVVLR